MYLLCNCMSYSPQLGVERLVFFDDARAVADWDAQFDPIVPLERCRGAQCSIYWASPGRRCLRRWALARAPAGAGRGSDAVVLRVHELSEEHSLVIFGSIT